MRNIMLVSILITLVVACNPFRTELPLDGTVCVRPGSTNEVIEATADAAEAWRLASGDRIRLNVIVAEGEQCDTTVAAGMREDAAGVCFVMGTPEIILDTFDRWDTTPPAETMVHELGHAMGANHSDRPTDAMHGHSDQRRTITDADLAKVLQ